MADRTAIAALGEADMYVQGVHRTADATVAAVRALLVGPDSPTMRMSVIDLVTRLGDEVFRAMNQINSMAEGFDAHFKDEQWHEVHRAVCNAVPAKEVAHV